MPLNNLPCPPLPGGFSSLTQLQGPSQILSLCLKGPGQPGSATAPQTFLNITVYFAHYIQGQRCGLVYLCVFID